MSSGGYAVEKKGSAATGTVTSVALQVPVGLFNLSGSPITTAGTIRIGLNNFAQNLVFASDPVNPGLSPSMRALVAADIPNLAATYAALAADNTFTSTGYLAVPNGTTVQQPGSPATGMIRYNTTTGRFEFYNGAWINYVKLAGDTMTGDLAVPNINVTTAVKLMDTTQKVALDVSAANTLRVGNGFTNTLISSLQSGSLSISDAGVYKTALNSTVAGQLQLGNGFTTIGIIVSNIVFSGSSFQFGIGTGTKFGTGTNQKLSFWNAAPIIQPTTAVTAATFVANTSGTVNDTATWDGYTIGQVVKALRNTGLLA